MHIARHKLDAALQYLLQLIRDGIEYPDAEWKASQRHGIPADALRTAYDEHCLHEATYGNH